MYKEDEYILSEIDVTVTGTDEISMINLKTGRRWTSPIEVKMAGKIKKKELNYFLNKGFKLKVIV